MRVVAALAERGGRVLLARRPLHKDHGGAWEFPGGKVEPGEEDAAALLRELREELAVDGRVGPLAGRVRAGPVELWLYRVELAGEPIPLEAMELGWFTPAEAASLPLPPGDRALLARLAAPRSRL